MKKILLTLIFTLLAFNTFSQVHKNIINVTGSHTYNPKHTYTVKVNASMSNVYYQEQDMSLEKIKSNYITKLKKAGIDITKIKENHLSYLLKGHQKDGVILEYTTTNIDKLQKFLTIISTGVTRQEVTTTSILSYEEMANNSNLAFNDAKNKAETIAKKLRKKVGETISYTDHNPREISDYTYDEKYFTEREYNISVSFEIL